MFKFLKVIHVLGVAMFLEASSRTSRQARSPAPPIIRRRCCSPARPSSLQRGTSRFPGWCLLSSAARRWLRAAIRIVQAAVAGAARGSRCRYRRDIRDRDDPGWA